MLRFVITSQSYMQRFFYSFPSSETSLEITNAKHIFYEELVTTATTLVGVVTYSSLEITIY